MLRSMKDLEHYAVGATDGAVGQVRDFFFDDASWVIRYLVVDTGSWLSGRKVLISPMSVRQADWTARLLPVAITKAQVESSPDIDTHKPVSRQHEMDYLGYYGYPYYWDGMGLWGEGLYPYPLLVNRPGTGPESTEGERTQAADARAREASHQDDDPHLRSCQAIIGYHIHASDGEIGHVAGMLVDEETWAIRYLVVDTSNWWMGHQVLVAPQWVSSVDWADMSVTVGLTRQAIQDAPPYAGTEALNRQQETDLHAHHQRPVYWGSGGA